MSDNSRLYQQLHVKRSLGHTLIGGLKEKLKQYTQHFSNPKRMKVVEEMMKDRNCSAKMLERLRRDHNATYQQHLGNAKTVLRAMQTLKTLKYMHDNKLKM